jgi:hypothetical protein
MLEQQRAITTANKTMRGRLPAPNGFWDTASVGDGRPCDGCADAIGPMEVLFTVVVSNALSFRFHAECCEAWMKLKEQG